MANNYKFYLDGVQLPINPASLTIKVGNKNETVDLANGGEMTVLKSPALTEVSFTARLPQMGLTSGASDHLPFANAGARSAYYYIEKMKNLKVSKKPFQFLVTRYLPNGQPLFENDLTVVLESFSTKEDANEGFDVLLDITLKQYIKYTTRIYNPNSNSSGDSRNEKTTEKTEYTIKSGDTLWALAKRFYGSGSLYTIIYNANKTVIESVAKSRGRNSSSNGHWIYPGTKLTIPKKE